MLTTRTRIGLTGLALAFIAAALLFASRLGIEADEALVGNGIYERGAPAYSWHIGSNEIPVMIISYLGALRTWLVHPLLDLFGAGRISLRILGILAGAATLWLFFALLDRIQGSTAAWIGALLLATDPSFLVQESNNYGDFAFHFVLKLAALLLLLRFHRGGRTLDLAIAFFLLGLGLWDKAVFSWVLVGLAAAAVVAVPKELWRHISFRNLVIALGSGIAGALPLVIYNIARPLQTFRGNARIGGDPLWAKSIILWRTLDGYVMFGFLTSADAGPQPGLARHWYQGLSLKIDTWFHRPEVNWMLIAFGAATIALVFLWQTDARKPMLFGLTATAATWVLMAATTGAGAAAHHVILLWPFPCLTIAVALSHLRRPFGIVLAALLCLSNFAVSNHYYATLIRNGPAIRWTDAIDPLNRYLLTLGTDHVFVADWGFQETLNLLSEGSLPVVSADTTDESTILQMFGAGDSVFVFHTAPFAVQPQLRMRIEDAAKGHGWRQEHLQTIYDQNGRPTFDVFRFRQVHL